MGVLLFAEGKSATKESRNETPKNLKQHVTEMFKSNRDQQLKKGEAMNLKDNAKKSRQIEQLKVYPRTLDGRDDRISSPNP